MLLFVYNLQLQLYQKRLRTCWDLFLHYYDLTSLHIEDEKNL